MKLVRGMKYISYNERLRELEFFSLAKEGFRKIPFWLSCRIIKERENNFLNGQVVIGQREMVVNWKMRYLG